MPKLRVLSGKKLVSALQKEGFIITRQKGSHVRLSLGSSSSLTIPLHPELDRGTLKAIIRALERVLPKTKLDKIFYQ
ncbi:type II toxin-antitoxin system HicA family toxin [Patescibacteria group bacterium]|nr:type II toxin-antitoxin system HicA family toxin [Patescibacteria group bacterium]MDE1941420.1 type II toxin-antitoxin system HicA family toxin [Patescibacteria group bacterium]